MPASRSSMRVGETLPDASIPWIEILVSVVAPVTAPALDFAKPCFYHCECEDREIVPKKRMAKRKKIQRSNKRLCATGKKTIALTKVNATNDALLSASPHASAAATILLTSWAAMFICTVYNQCCWQVLPSLRPPVGWGFVRTSAILVFLATSKR